MPLKLVVFFLIATENARKAVIEFQKLIFLGEDLQALKGHCNNSVKSFDQPPPPPPTASSPPDSPQYSYIF
jgi:hypothetical protein